MSRGPGWGAPVGVGVDVLPQGGPHHDDAPSQELFITSGCSPGGRAPLCSAGQQPGHSLGAGQQVFPRQSLSRLADVALLLLQG